MTGAFDVFAAAREAPNRTAFITDERSFTFEQAACEAAPRAAALLRARPRALALEAKADADRLLWLYAAFATGTPVLPLHEKASQPEREHAMSRVGASLAPAFDARDGVPSELPPVADRAPLVFLSTSGSTGTPRLVELSRAAVLASARASAQNLGWLPHDRWLLCLPLAHTGGLSVVTRCLEARSALVLFDPGPEGMLAAAPRLAHALEHATLVSMVPTVLERLLDGGFTPSPSLRAALVGGAGCSPALAERAHRARVPLLTSYGLTETASQVVTRRYAERFEPLRVQNRAVSSGHPLPGVSLRLDERGLVQLRSPSLLTCYVDEAAPLDADGWLTTTDRAELGPNGELYVLGRSDDVIVTGGENVDPREVEAALLTLPGVSAACVVGTPSAEFGAVVSALLVTSDTALAEPRRLAEGLRDRLARHKHPRRARIVQHLPLTPAGKLDRRAAERLLAAPEAEPTGASLKS